jgi:hypothetical protein
MSGFAPQRNVRYRRSAVPQSASHRAAQFANAVFAWFLLRWEKIPAEMSYDVLPEVPGDDFRSVVPELYFLVAVHHINAGLHLLEDCAVNLNVCKHRHGTAP